MQKQSRSLSDQDDYEPGQEHDRPGAVIELVPGSRIDGKAGEPLEDPTF
jgi:hypothetical protein